MAPTPVDNTPIAQPTNDPKKGQANGMTTASIVGLSITIFFALAFAVTLTGYVLYRRAERNKLPPEKRPASYHPFRTNSDKSGLLANAAPSPEEDKSSMFSRERSTSNVSLYVDSESHNKNKRASIDTVSLIPLSVTPAAEVHDPLDNSTSGTGVSSLSRYSFEARDSRLSVGVFSDIGTEGEWQSGRKTRPRSTSAASARYYEVNAAERVDGSGPTIPKIVHTPSP